MNLNKPNIIKTVTSALTLIGLVVGGMFFLEDRIDNKMAHAEEEAVKTFKMEQQLLRIEIEDLQRGNDLRYLEQLRCQKVIIEKELERDPNDTWSKESLEQIKHKIRILETKLF